MTRRPSAFRQRDLSKALRAVIAAGLHVAGVKVSAQGEIEVVTGEDRAQDSSSREGNEWDTVLRYDKIWLRFVQAFIAHGKPYYYFRKPGCARVKLPGLPGSAEFMDTYQAALAASAPPSDIGAKRSGPGTVNALVALYANSSQFKHEIAAETRRTMWAILRRFGDEHGGKRVALLRREHLLAILDGRAPFARRNWLRALRPLLDFAVSIKWIAENPANDIKAKVPRKGEGFRAWGEEQIASFRQHYAFGTRARLALELLLNTTQRRSDVVRMGPQHIRNGLLHVRQQKTGEPLQLPIFPELKAAIDAVPNRDRHLTFLTTKSGRPFSPAGFTNWFRHVCNEAGLRGYSAHGLRKASMTRLAEAGCSVHEIAAFSGHKTLSEIAHYTRSVEQAALAREAMAKARTKLSKSVGLTVKNRKKANENKSLKRTWWAEDSNLQPDRYERMVYYAFDLLHLDGFDTRAAPLVERKRPD